MRIMCRLLLTVLFSGVLAGTADASRFLITGADAGGGPHVIVRIDNDNNGTFETIGDSFYAFDPLSPGAPLFSGGVRVATGDFDGDGNDELVTAMGPGGPFVRIWRMTGSGHVAELLEQFAPYGGFNGGIFVATGDFDGDGRDELVTAPDAGGGPHIKVWRDVNRDGRFSDEPLMAQFFAYFASFSGGVRIAVGNVDNVGGDELITAPGPGGGPHVKVLSFIGGDVRLNRRVLRLRPRVHGSGSTSPPDRSKTRAVTVPKSSPRLAPAAGRTCASSPTPTPTATSPTTRCSTSSSRTRRGSPAACASRPATPTTAVSSWRW